MDEYVNVDHIGINCCNSLTAIIMHLFDPKALKATLFGYIQVLFQNSRKPSHLLGFFLVSFNRL